jgi:hypothetical protein
MERFGLQNNAVNTVLSKIYILEMLIFTNDG